MVRPDLIASPIADGPKPRLLLIDDDARVIASVSALFQGAGYEVASTTHPTEAVSMYGAHAPDVVIVDLSMQPIDGFAVLHALRTTDPHACIIMLTGEGDIDSAVRAMRSGAEHFLTKPFEAEHLLLAVERSLAHAQQLRNYRLARAHTGADHEACIALLTAPVVRLLDILARQRVPVAVRGERGTAKRVAAAMVHRLGQLADEPLLYTDARVHTAPALEALLFGQRFDGHGELPSRGLLTLARRGSVVIHRSELLPLVIQDQLRSHFSPTTTSAPVERHSLLVTRARLLCTVQSTGPESLSPPLSAPFGAIFGTLPIEVPPLRDRSTAQFSRLVRYLAQDAFATHGLGPHTVDDDAIDLLAKLPWHGNIAEVQDFLARAAALAPLRDVLGGDEVRGLLAGEPVAQFRGPATSLPSLFEVEREHVRTVMTATMGNIAEAARILGITRTTLYKKLREFDERY